MIKKLLITTLSLLCTLSFGQVTYTISDIDFEDVTVGTIVSRDVTFTSDVNSTSDYSIRNIEFFNKIIPDVNDSETGICQSNSANPFSIEDNNGNHINDIWADTLSPGESITLTINFIPNQFIYYTQNGYEYICFEPDGMGGCFFGESVPLCEQNTSSGLGYYESDITIRINRIEDNTLQYSTTLLAGTGVEGNATGINTEVNNLSIYPNPTSNVLYTELGELKIYNQLGNLCFQTVSTGKIDVSKLEKGLYFITQNDKTVKIIIE